MPDIQTHSSCCSNPPRLIRLRARACLLLGGYAGHPAQSELVRARDQQPNQHCRRSVPKLGTSPAAGSPLQKAKPPASQPGEQVPVRGGGAWVGAVPASSISGALLTPPGLSMITQVPMQFAPMLQKRRSACQEYVSECSAGDADCLVP